VSTLLKWTALVVSVVAWGSVLAGREAINVRVSGMCIAPCDVVVEAFIEPNEHNRSVSFVLESANFFTSSESTLDGDRAPRSKQVRFRSLPPGEYQVRVTLLGDQGERDYEIRTVTLR
jgi:hypothetical protein